MRGARPNLVAFSLKGATIVTVQSDVFEAGEGREESV
jgi:hypothetical protein